MGLMFNAILKIPMQFFILLTGVLVFVFYQYYERPIHFNAQIVETVEMSDRADEGEELVAKFNQLGVEKSQLLNAPEANKSTLNELEEEQKSLSDAYAALATEVDPDIETKDSDYVFIQWVLNFLPHGAIGLLLAVIFSAAMSSTAGELNALAGTTMNDFFKRLRNDQEEREGDVRLSKWITVGWGLLAIVFALAAQLVDNLIELVNILGSLFYGTILGVFICAFFLKRLRSKEVFIAAIVAEVLVLSLFFTTDIGFLWFNAIGCAAVIFTAFAAGFALPNSD